jgi:hypothetical protein
MFVTTALVIAGTGVVDIAHAGRVGQAGGARRPAGSAGLLRRGSRVAPRPCTVDDVGGRERGQVGEGQLASLSVARHARLRPGDPDFGRVTVQRHVWLISTYACAVDRDHLTSVPPPVAASPWRPPDPPVQTRRDTLLVLRSQARRSRRRHTLRVWEGVRDLEHGRSPCLRSDRPRCVGTPRSLPGLRRYCASRGARRPRGGARSRHSRLGSTSASRQRPG